MRHDILRAARTRKLIVIHWKYEVRNRNEEVVVIRTEGTYGMRNGKSCAEPVFCFRAVSGWCRTDSTVAEQINTQTENGNTVVEGAFFQIVDMGAHGEKAY